MNTSSAEPAIAATPDPGPHPKRVLGFRDLVYTMPPYVCTPADLSRITAAVVRAAAHGESRISPR